MTKATSRQRATLDSMAIPYDDEITIEDASNLIAARIAERKQMVVDFKRTHSIDEIIERYGGQSVGRDHKIYAPWRQESTPSVHIYEDGSWHDYGAGIGGDILDYIGHYFFGENYSRESHFPDVIDRIGALDIAPLPTPTVRPKPEKPRLAINLEQCLAWNEEMPPQRRAYWHSRGLSDHIIDAFYLGWDGKRYTIPLLYRLIPFGVKRRQSDVDDGIAAKYIMSAGSRAGIFNADALWTADTCFICEGEIDAMILDQLGYRAVTSTAGAGSWKDEWARFFTHIPNIYLLFDNDRAGRDGASKVHSTLRRAIPLTLPDGVKDVGELWQAGYAAAWLTENVG